MNVILEILCYLFVSTWFSVDPVQKKACRVSDTVLPWCRETLSPVLYQSRRTRQSEPVKTVQSCTRSKYPRVVYLISVFWFRSIIVAFKWRPAIIALAPHQLLCILMHLFSWLFMFTEPKWICFVIFGTETEDSRFRVSVAMDLCRSVRIAENIYVSSLHFCKKGIFIHTYYGVTYL